MYVDISQYNALRWAWPNISQTIEKNNFNWTIDYITSDRWNISMISVGWR